MIVVTYCLLAALLLLLNAFFVLAEFAVVKVRPTLMESRAATGNRRAKVIQHIQTKMDQYLSVCQFGITLASIGLGFVGEPAFAKILKPIVHLAGAGRFTEAASHGIAISIGYVLISALHIIIGELVPKSVAIRRTETSALLIAYPLQVFYYLFIVPLWGMNVSVNAILRLMGMPAGGGGERHTEDEIRIILEQSQSGGMMSFRRLLYIENVLDLGELTVSNAMRGRESICCLSTSASRAENNKIIASMRYSRYPLLGNDPDTPLGFVHVKDLLLAECAGRSVDDLKEIVRPALTAKTTDSLEQLLSTMQRRGTHLAFVFDGTNHWIGLITLEDVIEELTGVIEEEYPIAPPVYLADHLTSSHILLDVEGSSIVEATRNALARIPAKELPLPPETILRSVEDREKIVNSYVGHQLAIPHARLKGIGKPFVAVVRMREEFPAPLRKGEAIKLLFILLTPADTPRLHQIFLARIAGMLDSEFLEKRLHTATDPVKLYNDIRAAEQTVLD